MSGLSSRDYEKMLDLAVSVMDCRNAGSSWSMVAEELVRALRGTTCVFSRSHRFVQHTIQLGDVQIWTPWYSGPVPDDAPERARMGSHPLVRHYAETGDSTPLTISDILEERTWQSSEAFSLLRETSGATRHIALPLHELDSVKRGFVLGRSGIDFTAREREYVVRLQPLLTRVDAHLRELERWRTRVADPDDRAEDLRLTPREVTVLSLLTEGITAETMGRRLGISPRTVHRHLENLYRKLGTADRLSTVLRAQKLGLLPEGGNRPRRISGAGPASRA
ncbi:MAG TPA: helix-turn-helix transcriptional regulator [Amycolatopsis sp.]|nr:helix-turn-helix transcriptional regulator [Amycolatopsis sp.]